MDAVVEIRMDKKLLDAVEELYRGMGTTFEEAVRIFARESIRMQGMPIQPMLMNWENLTPQDVENKVRRANADIEAGRVYTSEEAAAILEARFQQGQLS